MKKAACYYRRHYADRESQIPSELTRKNRSHSAIAGIPFMLNGWVIR